MKPSKMAPARLGLRGKSRFNAAANVSASFGEGRYP